MNFTDLRLRIGRFFRNNRKIIVVVFIIWLLVFMINLLLKNKQVSLEPETSYTPHTSVMSSSSSVPTLLQDNFEELIDKYVTYCNNEEFELAFRMLSDECREYAFDNDIKTFMSYLITIMPTKKEYSIQNYSNMTLNGHNAYIYQVKYFDDILATGLTGQEYQYTEEKITFVNDNSGELKMYVGNYMYHDEIKRITENEYLKVDVVEKDVYYSMEKYKVKITNRSEYTIVIADDTEEDEIVLALSGETRKRNETNDIVLKPYESQEVYFTFFRYVDDGDSSNEITFENVRVMEKYSVVENVDQTVIDNEKNNAIAKFSISVAMN